MQLKINLEVPECLPTRANSTDAGLDLRALTANHVPPHGIKMINTGVSVKIPKGYVGLVFSRSGMGKQNTTLANAVGVIDSDYRGRIQVILSNHSNQELNIAQYDRIAQLVIVPIALPELMVESDEGWNDTERGTSGFGSTGAV